MKRTARSSKTYVTGALVLGAALAVAGMLVSPKIEADPVEDATLQPHRAGWFSNASRRGSLTCAQTCKAKAPVTLAEYEASAEAVPKRAFLCRVQGKPKGRLRTWLYGSQFDDRAACYTTGLDLEGSYAERYFCLCASK